MSEGEIKIYGAIRSMTGDGKAAYASQIYDETLEKFQSEINADVGKSKMKIENEILKFV